MRRGRDKEGRRAVEAAGDCASAFEIYARHYPPEALANLTDEVQREQVLRQGFASSFKVCGPQLTGSSAG